ncbi:MAG: amidase, partial [Caulobacteraceae bacterium]|nr:amidase [Caulobacter sp.]
ALALRGAGARPGAWAARTLAATASHHAWLRADEARARLAARMAVVFEAWDVVIAPAAPVTAFLDSGRRPPLGEGRAPSRSELPRWSALASTLGLPATCAPVGLAAGLPVGVQIIGPAGGDSRTLAVAEACEAELGGFAPPPLCL